MVNANPSQSGERYLGAAVVSFAKRGGSLVLAAICLGGLPARAQEIVVDNLDRTNAKAAGAWLRGAGPTGFYGSNYLVDAADGAPTAGKALKTFAFAPNFPVTDDYDVYVHAPVNPSAGAGNVPLTIVHAGGTDSVKFNQRVFGSEWVHVGRWRFRAGRGGSVTISNAGTDGTVAADAVKFARVVLPPPAASTAREVVVDNLDRANVMVTGSWTARSSDAVYRTNELLDSTPGTQAGKAVRTIRFAPNLPAADRYGVYVWHSSSANSASNVPITIATAAGVVNTSLDQRFNGGQWVFVGEYSFAAGRSGSVTIGNQGTNGVVSADAVRFLRAESAADKAVFAKGLAAWRRPDGNGITCMQCHGPSGYDIAVFNFNRADLRRATHPAHLSILEADQIFDMIQLQRAKYPPAGGLKDPKSFRPLQTANHHMVGSETETPDQQDAAFGEYLWNNFKMAGKRVETVGEARALLQELADLDLVATPFGLRNALWSHAVSREGHGRWKGESINEWVPGIGIKANAHYEAEWNALNDAYIADPSDVNFWAMMDKIRGREISLQGPSSSTRFFADTHNVRQSMNTEWVWISLNQLKANMLFQHDQLQRALGRPAIMDLQKGRFLEKFPGNPGSRPSTNPQGLLADDPYEMESYFWKIGDGFIFQQRGGRIGGGQGTFNVFEGMPTRHKDTLPWLKNLNEEGITDFIAAPWMWVGFVYSNDITHTGDGGGGEYFQAALKRIKSPAGTHIMYNHLMFFNAVAMSKRGLSPGYSSFNDGVTRFVPFKGFDELFVSNTYLGGRTTEPTPRGYPEAWNRLYHMTANVRRAMVMVYLDDIRRAGGIYTNFPRDADGRTHIMQHTQFAREFEQADPEWAERDKALLAEMHEAVRTLPILK